MTKFWAVSRKNSIKIILSTDFYIVLPSVFDDLDLGLLQEGGLCQIKVVSRVWFSLNQVLYNLNIERME